MTTTIQIARTRFAIIAIALLSLLTAFAFYAGHEWKTRQRERYQHLIDRKQAIEDGISLSKRKQQEVIEKIAEFKKEAKSVTGVMPTNEEGPIPGYKKEIAELSAEIAAGREQLARIKKEMSVPVSR